MIYRRLFIYIAFIFFLNHYNLCAQDNREFKIFQFPANMIPVIDGKKDDWNIVPSDYSIGISQMTENKTIGLSWAILHYDNVSEKHYK